jgi:hypothetical protein
VGIPIGEEDNGDKRRGCESTVACVRTEIGEVAEDSNGAEDEVCVPLGCVVPSDVVPKPRFNVDH